jgi:hypothetical protein
MEHDSMRTPRGYVTRRGDFYNDTTDDHADRWYTDKIGEPIDHRGQGYRTRREAIEALRDRLDDIEFAQSERLYWSHQ